MLTLGYYAGALHYPSLGKSSPVLEYGLCGLLLASYYERKKNKKKSKKLKMKNKKLSE